MSFLAPLTPIQPAAPLRAAADAAEAAEAGRSSLGGPIRPKKAGWRRIRIREGLPLVEGGVGLMALRGLVDSSGGRHIPTRAMGTVEGRRLRPAFPDPESPRGLSLPVRRGQKFKYSKWLKSWRREPGPVLSRTGALSPFRPKTCRDAPGFFRHGHRPARPPRPRDARAPRTSDRIPRPRAAYFGRREALAALATMEPNLKALTNVKNAVSHVRHAIAPLLAKDRTQLQESLTAGERAKLSLSVAYTVHSLFFCLLRSQGVNAKQHDVMKELGRVQAFLGKLKAAGRKGDAGRSKAQQSPAKAPAKARAKAPTKVPAKAPAKTPAKTPAKAPVSPSAPEGRAGKSSSGKRRPSGAGLQGKGKKKKRRT